MSTPIDDDMSMPLSIEHAHEHHDYESPIIDESPEEVVRVKKPTAKVSTSGIEHFTPMNQYPVNNKPNYKILLWVLLSSFLSNMVPESVISGLSKMVPEKAAMVSLPLTRAVMAVVIYAILNFLVQ